MFHLYTYFNTIMRSVIHGRVCGCCAVLKLFFSENAVSTLCHNTNAQAAKATAKTQILNGHGEAELHQGLLASEQCFPATVMPRDRYRAI